MSIWLCTSKVSKIPLLPIADSWMAENNVLRALTSDSGTSIPSRGVNTKDWSFSVWLEVSFASTVPRVKLFLRISRSISSNFLERMIWKFCEEEYLTRKVSVYKPSCQLLSSVFDLSSLSLIFWRSGTRSSSPFRFSSIL